MKKIDVISPIYKGISVNFNGFIVNFNAEGKSVVEIEDDKVELLEEVFKTHPNIFKGNKLPEKKVESAPSQQQANDNSSSEFEFLKNKNIELAKENSILKKENEELKNKISELEGNVKSDKEESSENEESNSEENNNSLEDELNSKTVSQLKEILNSEDFISFKEEWKGLTKKEDIIKFILSKL